MVFISAHVLYGALAVVYNVSLKIISYPQDYTKSGCNRNLKSDFNTPITFLVSLNVV